MLQRRMTRTTRSAEFQRCIYNYCWGWQVGTVLGADVRGLRLQLQKLQTLLEEWTQVHGDRFCTW